MMISRYIAPRPRKVSRDSANAAMELNSSVSTAVMMEVRKLERYQFQTSPWLISVTYDSSVGLKLVRISSAPSAATPFAVSDVLIANRLGISQRIARITRITVETRVKVRPLSRLEVVVRAAGAAAETPSRRWVLRSVTVMSGRLLASSADPGDELLDDGDHDDDEEQQHRGGGGRTGAVV